MLGLIADHECLLARSPEVPKPVRPWLPSPYPLAELDRRHRGTGSWSGLPPSAMLTGWSPTSGLLGVLQSW